MVFGVERTFSQKQVGMWLGHGQNIYGLNLKEILCGIRCKGALEGAMDGLKEVVKSMFVTLNRQRENANPKLVELGAGE